MKLPIALACFPCFSAIVSAQASVLIIESQSVNTGHTMDNEWSALATAAGYTVAAGTQATLASSTFHATTDILIVSSGVIDLPIAATNSIAAFLAQGGEVYLQSEYLTTYDTNAHFAALVGAHGGSFSWSGTVSGALEPVSVSSPLDGPLNVAPLDDFWYGATGTGAGVIEVLHDLTGTPLGWVFEGAPGRLVTTSDQDWCRVPSSEDLALMENILTYLETGNSLGTSFCNPAVPNSTGNPGAITIIGSSVAGDNDVTLVASSLPANQFAYFLNSQAQGFVPMPGGSQGNLCLVGAVGRYNAFVSSSGATGSVSLILDLPSTPTPTGPVGVFPGETWSYQCWYRDLNPAATSNFTAAVELTFQ